MLKNKLEALLFSSGRKMSLDELSRLTKSNPEDIQNTLIDLKRYYDGENSSVMLINEGDSWKLTVREQFLSLVQKIVTQTELSKTLMETLAVIAFKYPIKQSELIKIRSNKAYEHLAELEEMGYITRQKHGRTNLIKLSQKFFEYFNLPEEKLKEQFQDFDSISKAIEEKEHEIEKIKREQLERAKDEGQKDEKIKQEIEMLDEESLKNNNTILGDKTEIVEDEEKLGDLEVVDEPSEEELENERQRMVKLKGQDDKKTEQYKDDKKPSKSHGIEVDEETEKKVDERVENILHPKNQEENR